jgi:tRNA (guanine37-N1)-methyltransferase
MKITAISIFPEYFAPLKLSLIGKAIENKQLEVTTVDLRDYAEGVHRSVDDTPYGGGAGMVMSPEPWGKAIDELVASSNRTIDLIILTPSGEKFNQRLAEELANSEEITFVCGRYEGIDSRVADFYRKVPNVRVREISIGDYVLNGGEVAALVIIEAITRLIPGVIGNPDSLNEESHNEIGQLEYPVYTKPATWRGLSVPEVLISGNHGAIAKWRQEESKKRSNSQKSIDNPE